MFNNNMHTDKNTGLVINSEACATIYVDDHIDTVPYRLYI